MIDAIRQTAYTTFLESLSTQKTTANEAVWSVTPIYTPSTDTEVDPAYDTSYQPAEVTPYLEKNIYTLTDEEAAALYQSGYVLEDYTMDEMLYVASQSETTHTEETVHYEPIENKIDCIQTQSKSMYYYAMQQGTVTINSLYQASFGGTPKGVQDYLKGDIDKVLGYNSIPCTTANRQAADRLMSLGLDVSKDAVTKIQNIQAAIEGLDKADESKKALEDLEAGKEPGNRPLLEDEKILYSEKTVREVNADPAKVDTKAITDVLDEGEEVTITNLRAAMLKNTQHALKGEGDTPNWEGHQEREEVDTVKEQIRQIRVMLTADSARRISEQMPLESTELTKVVKALQGIQDEVIEDAANKAALPLTEEVHQELKDVMEAMQTIKNQRDTAVETVITAGDVPRDGGKVELEALHATLVAYEQVGTVPEQRFGEDLSKLSEALQAFLLKNDLPQDTSTLEAARALVTNDMTLTAENLQGVKEVMTKIDTLLTDLTPYQAAEMIKEGISPYKASIDKLVDWLGTKQLPQFKESIASAIVSLEDKGKITEAQKQSLIGVYRILQSVEKNKDEVVGYLYKNQLPLTMERLEEAVKYGVKGRQVDRTIDSQFGELKALERSSENARERIENSELSTQVALVNALEKAVVPLSQEDVASMTNLKTLLYPFFKHYLKEHLGKYERLDVLPESFKEKVSALKNVDTKTVEALKTYQIPVTLNNLYWIQRLHDQPELFKDLLQQAGKKSGDFPEKASDLRAEQKALEEEVTTQKESCMQQGDLTGYKSHKELQEMVEVQKQLNQKEGFYQIPFVLQGETRMVNMYVKEQAQGKDLSKDRMDMAISYDTEALGNIKAYITLTGERLSYKIVGEDLAATRQLQYGEASLKAILEGIGYVVDQVSYGTEEPQAASPVTWLKDTEGQFEALL